MVCRKDHKAGTNADISCNATSEGSIRNEKRTSSVKWPSDSRLSYSIRMVSIAKEVLGKSMAKFSIRIFRSLAIIFRLSVFQFEAGVLLFNAHPLDGSVDRVVLERFQRDVGKNVGQADVLRVELAPECFRLTTHRRYLSASYQE